MKKITCYTIAALMLNFQGAQAELTCDPAPQSAEDAKTCAKTLLGKTEELNVHLQEKQHLGDMANCQRTQAPASSYFGNNGLDKVLKEITLKNCEDAGEEYKCFVNLYQNACFITQIGTRSKTKTAIVRMDKNGKLIDFYPVNKQ